MWIRTTRDELQRRFNDDVVPDDAEEPLDKYRLDFNANGTVQVPREVGEAYAAYYEDMTTHDD